MTTKEESTMGNKVVNFIITSSEHPSIKKETERGKEQEKVKLF